MTALNRKLLRDVWGMRGQAIAIALVIGSGVAMYVMYLSNFDSLRRTQEAYYQRQAFGDVFVSLKRAPVRLADRLAAIPGVAAVEARVIADVTLDVPGLSEPATGRLVSVPADRRPRVNDVFLRRGRWVDAARPDDVLASEAFVDAHGFQLGDRVAAIVNGRRRVLTIVGIALSPEYVYAIRPGEIVPDDRRFAIFWMERRALAGAYDMEGGFNDASLRLARDASVAEVVRRVDRLLEPYGGLGAVPRALQFSHWTLENELRQLENFGFVIPLIFLLVAAFILNVALSRALGLQRPQIAALKALGYGSAALGWHYIKWALLIAGVGVVFGIGAGSWLGERMIALYNQYFRFPLLEFGLNAGIAMQGAALSLAAAALGAFSAVRRAVAIPPAEAMRPEPPERYRRSIVEQPVLVRVLSTAGRMVLRNLERQPWRATSSVSGIAFAGGILVVGFVFVDAMERLIETEFSVAQRQTLIVSFFEPRSADARHSLARLPGVLRVEPFRTVPVRVRAGHRQRTLAMTGLPAAAELRRIVDEAGRAYAPGAGLTLSQKLADVLHVSTGDRVMVDVLEGDRPVFELRVARTVRDTLGLSAWLQADALHRLLGESTVISGAALLVDPSREAQLAETLKQVPAVAGVAIKSSVLQSFRDVLSQNMNIMITLNVVFAGIIAFGVVYNAARVSLSERSRELASLRVLGFTRAEISLILLGELAVLTLAAMPLAALIGYGLAAAIVNSLDSEVYRFALVVSRGAVAKACLTVMAAALFSALVVRRRIDHLDLVAVLKIRE